MQVGALVPLARPGWVEAGRHLLAGLQLAVREVNDVGGIAGRPLELVIRDTAADPHKTAAAVDELARLGVAALTGEYHSIAARAAARADAQAGGSSSPARQALAPGSGLRRQSKSSIEIRRSPVAFGSFTPAESTDVSAVNCPPGPVSVTAGP